MNPAFIPVECQAKVCTFIKGQMPNHNNKITKLKAYGWANK